MGDLIPLRPHPLPRHPDRELMLIDELLAAAEETLSRAYQVLPKLFGPWRQIALSEIEELESKKRRLEQQRLRIAGAEFCLIKGGKP